MDSLHRDSVSSWQQSWSWEVGWHIVGWTMLYFLAAGTVLLAMLWFVRLILKNAQPRVRYATTLAGFAVLALMPINIAGWLAIDMASPLRERGELTTPELPEIVTNDTKELFNAEVAKIAEDPEKNFLVAEVTENRVPGQTLSVKQADSLSFESALNRSVEYLPWVWLIGTPLTFLLLATGLVGADRLRRSCRVLTDGPIHRACEQLRIALGIGREVGIAICDRVATPLLVGVVRPLILLPPAALLGWPPEQLEMVLLHELAHVRRWDNAVNLTQRIVESVLFFHPAVWIVSNWVRRDREDCCDAVVVGHTAKPQAYAELLLALASHQPLAGLAASAMARHPLSSRIRRILKLEDEPMLVSRKGLMLSASAVMAVVLCVVLLARSEAEEAVSRDSERVADERSSETTTKDSNDTKEDIITEVTEETESTEEKKIDSDSVEVRRVYVLGENETEIKNWLKAVDGLAEVNVFTKDGKEMAAVAATSTGHEKLEEMLKRKRGEATGTMFPTLEDQKAADFAYKLLGVELEKLTPEELDRVKVMGYAGGLRIASNDNRLNKDGPLEIGDLLVGLHVWPTESLEQVQDILTRFDIHDLTPLKFYVIRRQPKPEYGGPTGVDSFEDSLIKGRIAVNLTAWAEKEGFKQERLPHDEDKPAKTSGQSENAILLKMAEKNHELAVQKYEQSLEANQRSKGSVREIELHELKTAADLAQLEVERQRLQLNASSADLTISPPGNIADRGLLYDGKTFEQWRNLWKTELKTEKRIECINALAAFGRAGKGTEAAEAILEVAGEYHFGIISDGSAGDLKQAITEVMGGNEGFPGQHWLPLLIDRLKSDPDKWSYFAHRVLKDVQGKDVVPYLKQLATDNTLTLDARGSALAGLAAQPDIADNAEAMEIVRKALTGDEPVTQILHQLRFNRLNLFPEQFELLFHKNEQIRNQALGIASSGGFDSEPILEMLLEMLDDPARSGDREKSIIALYRLKGYFVNIRERRQRVTDKITEILIRGDTELLPASLVLMSLLTAKDESLVIKELGDKVTEERREQLRQAGNKAAELKSQVGRGGVGGGGTSGGGMF